MYAIHPRLRIQNEKNALVVHHVVRQPQCMDPVRHIIIVRVVYSDTCIWYSSIYSHGRLKKKKLYGTYLYVRAVHNQKQHKWIEKKKGETERAKRVGTIHFILIFIYIYIIRITILNNIIPISIERRENDLRIQRALMSYRSIGFEQLFIR